MHNIIPTQKKNLLSPAQKKFNRLKKKISTLQKKRQQIEEECELLLNYYSRNINPAQEKLVESLENFLKMLFPIYAQSKISSKDKKIFKELLIDRLEELRCFKHAHEIDQELQDIFDELTGEDLKEIENQLFNQEQNKLSDLFKEMGLDLDLSDIHAEDDPYDAQRKIFEAIDNARQEAEENQKEKPKSKKEERYEQLKQIKDKGINTLYKELAKELHPDLEQCPDKKVAKLEAMKQITAAYQEKDLHLLIQYKMDLLTEDENKSLSEDNLSLYNSFLEDQAKQLQTEVDMMRWHPRFSTIAHFASKHYHESFQSMQNHLRQITSKTELFNRVLEDLKNKPAKQVVQAMLKEYAEAQSMAQMFSFLSNHAL